LSARTALWRYGGHAQLILVKRKWVNENLRFWLRRSIRRTLTAVNSPRIMDYKSVAATLRRLNVDSCQLA
jgi:hypothetical protein